MSKESTAKKEIRELLLILHDVNPASACFVITRTLTFLASGKSGYPPPGPERELVRAARRLAKYEQERETERKKAMA